jgi:methylmalonyl-CoA mutase cobalamin-binding subunit
MTRLARSQHFDVIGISVAWGALLDGIASAIQSIRKNSVNKAVVVMVGGAIFLENPQLVSRVGADGMAEDGRHAILQLRTLLNAKITNA